MRGPQTRRTRIGGLRRRRPLVEKCHTIDIDHLTVTLASLADAGRDVLPDDHPADDLSDIAIFYRWSDEHGHGDEVPSVGLYPVWDGDHRHVSLFNPYLNTTSNRALSFYSA